MQGWLNYLTISLGPFVDSRKRSIVILHKTVYESAVIKNAAKKGKIMVLSLEDKKFLIDQLLPIENHSGEMASHEALLSWSRLCPPTDLSAAICFLELWSSRFKFKSLLFSTPINEEEQRKLFLSHYSVKFECLDAFVLIARRFRNFPYQSAGIVDKIFQHFYQALLLLAKNPAWTSLN